VYPWSVTGLARFRNFPGRDAGQRGTSDHGTYIIGLITAKGKLGQMIGMFPHEKVLGIHPGDFEAYVRAKSTPTVVLTEPINYRMVTSEARQKRRYPWCLRAQQSANLGTTWEQTLTNTMQNHDARHRKMLDEPTT